MRKLGLLSHRHQTFSLACNDCKEDDIIIFLLIFKRLILIFESAYC